MSWILRCMQTIQLEYLWTISETVMIVRKKQKIRIIESDSGDINEPKVVVNYTNSIALINTPPVIVS